QAAAFKEATDVGSILVTKLDGTAKGGGALSAVAATDAPIKFVGTGEKLDELEPFVPERFVARLLGMGDIETLLRRVKETMKPEEVKPEEVKAIMAGKLSLRDVYNQLEQVSKMGPLKKLLQMVPGVGMSLPDEQMRIGEEKLKRFKVIMQSMTSEELDNPRLIKGPRIRRIARGSGTSEKNVRELLKQYELMRKLIKSVARGRIPKAGPLGKLLKQMPKDMREFR
ncbi:MAG: signal recognition particle protein Srp19, partial [Candidatus Hadarchaeota archaeon]|nr:signal recognition particle protein Srp19 [Candidatus Hadarchaeota archaeon]